MMNDLSLVTESNYFPTRDIDLSGSGFINYLRLGCRYHTHVTFHNQRIPLIFPYSNRANGGASSTLTFIAFKHDLYSRRYFEGEGDLGCFITGLVEMTECLNTDSLVWRAVIFIICSSQVNDRGIKSDMRLRFKKLS